MSDKVGPNPGPVNMHKCLAGGEKLPEAVKAATTPNGAKTGSSKDKR